jgi:hypothetical protein
MLRTRAACTSGRLETQQLGVEGREVEHTHGVVAFHMTRAFPGIEDQTRIRPVEPVMVRVTVQCDVVIGA